jgi:hypothetical protein|tara:strand:- start:334 stop:579 length:246 start_codon:yes stop_codon:yes gene_type:complete
MAGENQKELSKKLDTKVKQMEIGDTLGNIIVTSKRLRDQLNKKDKLKASQGLRMGGRAGYKMGSKCKLAKKGKGRAYGKNS